MLKLMRAQYTFRNIFSLINDKTKFKLVKYNKKLKKLFELELIDYKRLSGKYIIYESMEKGKEYEGIDGRLIYEGGFLNGERHGYGKEFCYFSILKYEEPSLVFEGEYFKGKRNGKGKEYYIKDKGIFSLKKEKILKFEGEYLNNKKWNGKGYDINNNKVIYEIKNGKGLVKEFNLDNELIFEGEYLNGERNGKGKEYDYNELIFEGQYLNGKRWNGKGYGKKNKIKYKLEKGKGFVTEYYWYNNNILFEGQFINGEKNGIIKEYDNMGKLEFKGEYLNGKRNGKGIEYDYTGIRFKGEYLNDKRHGKGIEYENYHLVFEGEYYNGSKKKGKYYVNNQLEFEGEFLYNEKWNGKGYNKKGKVIYELINGNGKVKEYSDFNNNLLFEGEYLNGKRNGFGKEYYFNSFHKFKKPILRFEGYYLNGKRNGKGVEYANIYEKSSFEGEYLNGKRNGYGKEYYEDMLIFEGEYLDDKEWNGKSGIDGKIINGKNKYGEEVSN